MKKTTSYITVTSNDSLVYFAPANLQFSNKVERTKSCPSKVAICSINFQHSESEFLITQIVVFLCLFFSNLKIRLGIGNLAQSKWLTVI